MMLNVHIETTCVHKDYMLLVHRVVFIHKSHYIFNMNILPFYDHLQFNAIFLSEWVVLKYREHRIGKYSQNTINIGL